jgi:Uncharacterized lipoprotein
MSLFTSGTALLAFSFIGRIQSCHKTYGILKMSCYINKIESIHIFRTNVMQKTKAVVIVSCLLLLAGTLGGCSKKNADKAFLDLNPRILIHESDQGGGKNLKISVLDKRRRNLIMKKDSERKIRSGRALVAKDYHPSLKLDTNFQQTATEAFQKQGYETDGKGTGSVRELTIFITKLDLRLRKESGQSGALPQVQARLRTKIKVSAINRGLAYGSEYEFFIKKSYPTLPEKIETEKILNYGLTQLLHQVLEDPKLAQFLTS